jgi:hypothetical protein
MKRVMRFLVRFYPLSWRNRYGVGFDALIEDATLTVPETFDVFWGALKMQMTPWSFGRVTFARNTRRSGSLVHGTSALRVVSDLEGDACRRIYTPCA